MRQQHHDHRGHEQGHEHEHGHGGSLWSRIRHQLVHLATPHGHEAMDKVDSAMETSAEGMRTLRQSLGIAFVLGRRPAAQYQAMRARLGTRNRP